MAKFIFFFVSLMLTSSALFSQSIRTEWSGSAHLTGGTAQSAQSNAVARDDNGNVFITGSFRGTVDFDPGPEIFELTSQSTQDLYVLKLGPTGNFLWVKQYSTTGGAYNTGWDLEVMPNGDLLVVGKVDFDFSSDPNDSEDKIIILKYDLFGNIVLDRKIGGTGYNDAKTLDLDNQGNIIISGTFSETTDFDSGVDTLYMTTSAQFRTYILKLTSSADLIWAKSFEGAGTDYIREINTDSNDNVIIVGYFGNTVDFDPGVGVHSFTAPGFSVKAYITKFDENGDFVWAKVIEGTGNSLAYAVEVDSNDDIVLAGNYLMTADLDPGISALNYTSNGGADLFLMKLNSSGDLIWAHSIGGIGHEACSTLAIDNDNSIIFAGEFSDATDFDPSPSMAELTPAIISVSNIFIEKMTPVGDFTWVEGYGEDGCQSSDILIDDQSVIYATGTYSDSFAFDECNTTNALGDFGSRGCWISKHVQGACDLSANDLNLNQLSIYPNPVDKTLSIDLPMDESKQITVVVYTILQEVVCTYTTNSISNQNRINLDFSDYSQGTYLVTLKSEDHIIGVQRIVKK